MDPMSHRIIEKRRRDRMNNCLADLSRLIPTSYLKKARGRIEKTEIIEMAIKHLKHLQAHSCKDPGNCEVAKFTEQDRRRQYQLGFQECMSETVRFLVEIEGFYAGEGVCFKLVNHLKKHYDKLASALSYQHNGYDCNDGRNIDMESESSPPLDLNYSNPHSIEMAYQSDSNHEGALDEPGKSAHEGLTLNGGTQPPIAHTVPEEHHHHPIIPSVPLGTTSQLREMLQNPGLPIERLRSNSISSSTTIVTNASSVTASASTSPVTCNASNSAICIKNEEFYKYKNTIKERFNADLQHKTTPPNAEIANGDHHHDRAPEHKFVPQNSSGTRGVIAPVTNGNSFSRHNNLPALHNSSELSVKIPTERQSDSGPHSNGAWDNQTDSGSSSCGSNPSPPSIASRSNGSSSSSGYSTSGDARPYTPKIKPQLHQNHKNHNNERHSPPAFSPYSHPNSDRLQSANSPTNHLPLKSQPVPVFALHPKGTFYIPLTIDAAFIIPYLSNFDESASVLHPVNISVNFSICRQVKVPDGVNGTWPQRPYAYFPERCIYPDHPTTVPYPISAVVHN